MRKPILNVKYCKQRRERLKKSVGKVAGEDKAFVFFSGHAPTRSNDTAYKFRVNNNFFYLTGFEEAGSVLIFRPGKTPETTVFVQPKDPVMETWEGFLFGEEAAKSEFGFDEAHSISEFDSKVVDLLSEVDVVVFKIGEDAKADEKVLSAMKTVLKKKGRKGHPLQSIVDPDKYMAGLRLIKTDEEIELMKEAARVSAEAHVEVMKSMKPGLNEAYLEGVFTSEIVKRGAKDQAYNCISAGGNNATTLHYIFNDEDCKDGDLYLIDAGAEYKYYAGDITRTYPVGAKFTETQKDVYQKVLDVQKSLVKMVKPGCTFTALNEFAIEALTKSMLELGLLKGALKENLEEKSWKKYYPHGVGHYIGMDVHDIGYYEKNNEPLPFEPGVCLTIEPGIYVPLNDMDAPEHLRGIGIRIEDDVLVTAGGHFNMTSMVPKEIDEMLALKEQN